MAWTVRGTLIIAWFERIGTCPKTIVVGPRLIIAYLIISHWSRCTSWNSIHIKSGFLSQMVTYLVSRSACDFYTTHYRRTHLISKSKFVYTRKIQFGEFVMYLNTRTTHYNIYYILNVPIRSTKKLRDLNLTVLELFCIVHSYLDWPCYHTICIALGLALPPISNLITSGTTKIYTIVEF
jgi:hypothetical protein